MVILGIDPGLNRTGFGAITWVAGRIRLLEAGDIRPPNGKALSERLGFLHEGLITLLRRRRPQAMVLEMVFTHQRYLSTAAMMAHARGVACLAAQQQQVSLIEYAPARVKKALTGHGAATKQQVAHMVAHWIGTSDPSWSYDATDALALAVAHAHMEAVPDLAGSARSGSHT